MMNDADGNPAGEEPRKPSDDYKQQRRLKWRRRNRAYWGGVGLAVLAGALAMLFAGYLISRVESQTTLWATYLSSQFIAIPIGMGIAASFFWRNLDLSRWAYFNGILCILAIGIAMSYFVIHEGVICLIMASPLLFVCISGGVAMGKKLWKRAPWLGVSTLPLLITLIITDASMPHHYSSTVTDRILIHAPPAAVWRYVPAYPAITAPPHYWLWKIGLPVPLQSTVQGVFNGARRDCRFTGNVTFEEKIVELKPAKELTFIVTRQPDYPEIIGHFNLDRGQFLLHDNGDGTTTLTGTTWYRLHVFPAQYFDLWTVDIIRKVHLRVMDRIKELAERDARNPTNHAGEGVARGGK